MKQEVHHLDVNAFIFLLVFPVLSLEWIIEAARISLSYHPYGDQLSLSCLIILTIIIFEKLKGELYCCNLIFKIEREREKKKRIKC